MKNQNTFREITQALARVGGIAGFGLSIVTPLVVCILFAVWLHTQQGVGEWVIVTAVFVGLISSGCGAYRSIRAFLREEAKRDAKKSAKYPPLAPKRDPNETWHISQRTDEKKDKLE